MDSEKDNANKPVSGELSALPVPLIGNWTIEKNPPYGFVIRNVDPRSLGTEYHFTHDSCGWVTSVIKGAPSGIFCAQGVLSNRPVLVDRESTRKQRRIAYLKSLGKKLTPDEAKELLVLTGLIAEEK